MKVWQWFAVTIAGAVVGYYVTQYLANRGNEIDFGIQGSGNGGNSGTNSWSN